MRAVRIFAANPRDQATIAELEKVVTSHLELHPESKLTHLQSSASWSTDDGTMGDEHVLTIVAEFEIGDAPPAKRRR